MKNILITGGAGFIGSTLIDTLLSTTDYTLFCIDNFNDYYSPKIKENNCKNFLNNPRVHLIRDDILNLDNLESIFKNNQIDILIHLAARAGVRPSLEDPILYANVNVTGTTNLLECARKYGVKKVLSASSSSVYGNNKKVPFSEADNVDTPVSPYAATKKATELIAHTYSHLYKLPIANLRFFTVYGPRQRPDMAIHKFTKKLFAGDEIPVFNNGESLRDYTYIDDIVQGIITIMNTEFSYDIINLGESQTISTLELIKTLEKLTGKTANLNLMPAQPGDVDQTYADITHARTTYNYTPQYPIEKGLEKFVSWFKKETMLK